MNGKKLKVLAEKRLNGAIKQIRLIGNLSSQSHYGYGEGQVQKIFKALEREQEISRSHSKTTGDATSGRFEL